MTKTIALWSSYLIFDRPVEDGIQVIRVVHGARDITPEYFGDE